jgi:transcriptional pleiotropic regulator of transition state genes
MRMLAKKVSIFKRKEGLKVKSTGIVRKVDDLGRVVIPKETRKISGISEGTPLEIFIDGDKIVLRKYATGCVFCGEETATNFKDKLLCHKCKAELRR